MTTPTENREQAALEQRLSALRAELQETLAKTKSRRATLGVALVILLLVVAGYLSWIYHALSAIDADYLAEIAYAQVLTRVNDTPHWLKDTLHQRAPEFFDYAEKSVLQAPATGSNYLRDTIMSKTNEVLDEAQPKLDSAIDDAMTQVKDSAKTANVDTKDPAQVSKLVDQLVAQINKDLTERVDKIYADYVQQADQFTQGIDELADGKNLDALQEHQRTIIVNFLALNEKWKTNPPQLMTGEAEGTAAPPPMTEAEREKEAKRLETIGAAQIQQKRDETAPAGDNGKDVAATKP